ncbi:hypothetical protein OG394_07005 [Kribbella sp. NBC_01245]|uniref:hypothetical protein n=1 Tax=Kribbella sp. NBC_01245 TaxID=2903578 RepID=UPI002E2E7C63|nr:hypothetical protein [Kribbella sp. NBC_01245]
MQYTDWGERAARWSGIRSETVDVHGMKVHYLVTDQARTPEVPVHLLVPSPAIAPRTGSMYSRNCDPTRTLSR